MTSSARAPRAREFSLACVGVLLAATLACATQAKVTRLTAGTYAVECNGALAPCLVSVQEICREYGYDVVSASEKRDYVEQPPQGYESVKANATVRCRQATPLFGRDPNAPAPVASATLPAAPPVAAVAPAAPVPPPAQAAPLDGGAP